jgi:hypothetical protein
MKTLLSVAALIYDTVHLDMYSFNFTLHCILNIYIELKLIAESSLPVSKTKIRNKELFLGISQCA